LRGTRASVRRSEEARDLLARESATSVQTPVRPAGRTEGTLVQSREVRVPTQNEVSATMARTSRFCIFPAVEVFDGGQRSLVLVVPSGDGVGEALAFAMLPNARKRGVKVRTRSGQSRAPRASPSSRRRSTSTTAPSDKQAVPPGCRPVRASQREQTPPIRPHPTTQGSRNRKASPGHQRSRRLARTPQPHPIECGELSTVMAPGRTWSARQRGCQLRVYCGTTNRRPPDLAVRGAADSRAAGRTPRPAGRIEATRARPRPAGTARDCGRDCSPTRPRREPRVQSRRRGRVLVRLP
jgi:hypothetical protein